MCHTSCLVLASPHLSRISIMLHDLHENPSSYIIISNLNVTTAVKLYSLLTLHSTSNRIDISNSKVVLNRTCRSVLSFADPYQAVSECTEEMVTQSVDV